MSAPWLFEGIERSIVAHIKANIEQALEDTRLRSPVTDNPWPYKVNAILPKKYFTYVDAIDYQLPAIFVISKSMDMRQEEKGGNFITGQAEVQVTCVVEDKRSDLCNALAYRYASALHSILDQANLTISGDLTPPQGVANDFVRVSRIENSDLFTQTEDKTRSESVFRKEIALYLKVEHFENF
ncbi:MAG: hypothetical protein BWZ03_00096 [bacterium ADurb.BinA186]|nr:MAG: hypothetical protein BWZ03_00096 [bacterium ADurb.BinA186]